MTNPAPPLEGWLAHESSWLVQEQDLDLFGHLNNVSALAMLDRARWQMITERGHGYDLIRERNQGPVILGIDVQFRKEVGLRQRVTVETYTATSSGKVSSIVQIVRGSDSAVHIVATYTIGLFDLVARRLIAPTPAWLRACGAPEALIA